MKYIELMGQPGAGKSSVYNRLLNQEEYLGAIGEKVIQRTFLRGAGPLSRLVYKSLPEKVRSYIQRELLSYRFRYHSFEKFLQQHPGLTEFFVNYTDIVTNDLEGIISSFKYNAEWYQLGRNVVRDHERLCIDEGFAHMAVALLRRSRDGTFPIDQYLNSVPSPDVLIHIDVPPEVALRRQQQRGRVPADAPWATTSPEEAQQRLRDLSLRVKGRYADTTEVLSIKNVSSLDQTVTEVMNRVECCL